MKTIRFVVDGEVQGKTYRPHIVAKARKHKVKGYVKNLPDGTVEIECYGEEAIINGFYEDVKGEIGEKLKDCLANVTQVSDPEELPIREYKHFGIEYGKTNEEIAEGLATGAAYIKEIREDIGGMDAHIKNGFNTTGGNFKGLDSKYHVISYTIAFQTLLLVLILLVLVVGFHIT